MICKHCKVRIETGHGGQNMHWDREICISVIRQRYEVALLERNAEIERLHQVFENIEELHAQFAKAAANWWKIKLTRRAQGL